MEQEKNITISKKGIARFYLQELNEKGEAEKTGEYIDFDFESFEWPLKIAKCEEMHNSNLSDLQLRLNLVEKKEDVAIKNSYLTRNQREKLELMHKFCEDEMKAIDLILGDNGCKKFLNGRSPYIEMFDDIMEALEPIMPKLKQCNEETMDRIKKKYSKKEENVLE